MRDQNLVKVVASEAAEEEWTEHVLETAEKMLFAKVDSWFMGVNKNLPHKRKRRFLLYAGGSPAYRERCNEVAADNYRGFQLE
jgi:hypothetical protein